MKYIQFCLAIFLCVSGFSGIQRFHKSEKSCELVEQTLVIIKPEAVADRNIGVIIADIENQGLEVIGMKMVQMAEDDARIFYRLHKKKNFYADLVKYMSSGPIVVAILEGRNAVTRVRKLIGDTNPQAASKGTIREKYGQTIQRNAIHASDTLSNAKKEILFFFTADQLFSPCARIVFRPQ